MTDRFVKTFESKTKATFSLFSESAVKDVQGRIQRGGQRGQLTPPQAPFFSVAASVFARYIGAALWLANAARALLINNVATKVRYSI